MIRNSTLQPKMQAQFESFLLESSRLLEKWSRVCQLSKYSDIDLATEFANLIQQYQSVPFELLQCVSTLFHLAPGCPASWTQLTFLMIMSPFQQGTFERDHFTLKKLSSQLDFQKKFRERRIKSLSLVRKQETRRLTGPASFIFCLIDSTQVSSSVQSRFVSRSKTDKLHHLKK